MVALVYVKPYLLRVITNHCNLFLKVFLNELNLERVDVKSKFGRLIMWNCGVAHGNSKCQNTTLQD